MTKYTSHLLDRDCAVWNRKLEAAGKEERFGRQGRNGYQAVDLYRLVNMGKPSQYPTCERTLVTGTPRDCKMACLEYLVAHLL